MRKLIPSLIFILLYAMNPDATAQQQTKQHIRVVRKTTINYLSWLPAGYKKEKAKKYPLLIFLHGSGERGDNLDLVKRNGPPSFLDQRSDFPFITISPQCPENKRWDTENLQAMLQILLKKYRIDQDRIYLTGLSMGGFGTWAWACSYPDQFAAIVPVCGGGDVQFAKNLKNTPVWAFHGDADPVVPVNRTIDMVAAVNAAGGKARITVYPGVGHDSWIKAYQEPELYNWLLSHTRNNK